MKIYKTHVVTTNQPHHFRPCIEGVERLANLYKEDFPKLHWGQWNLILERTKRNSKSIHMDNPQVVNLIFEDILDGFLSIELSDLSIHQKEILWMGLGKTFEKRRERDPFGGLAEDEGYFTTLRDTFYLKLKI